MSGIWTRWSMRAYMNRWRFVISNMLMGSYWQARMFQDVLYLRLMYVRIEQNRSLTGALKQRQRLIWKNTFNTCTPSTNSAEKSSRSMRDDPVQVRGHPRVQWCRWSSASFAIADHPNRIQEIVGGICVEQTGTGIVLASVLACLEGTDHGARWTLRTVRSHQVNLLQNFR